MFNNYVPVHCMLSAPPANVHGLLWGVYTMHNFASHELACARCDLCSADQYASKPGLTVHVGDSYKVDDSSSSREMTPKYSSSSTVWSPRVWAGKIKTSVNCS